MANKRRSSECFEHLRAIQENLEPESQEQKIKEWQEAVTEELKLLHERQNNLEQNFDKNYGPSASPRTQISQVEVINRDLNEKITFISDKLEGCFNQIKALNEEMNSIKIENDNLKSTNENLTQKLNNIVDKIVDAEDLEALKKYCLSQVDQVAEKSDLEIQQIRSQINGKNYVASNQNTGKRIKFALPKYKGLENERPIKFLSDLEKYLTLTKPDEDELQCIISQTLEESAQEWWFLHQDEVETYEDFVYKFKERYWNATIQRANRRKIEFNEFRPGGKMTRVNYATYIFNLAKELELDYDEVDLVKKVITHFGREIRHTLIAQPIKSANVKKYTEKTNERR